MFTHSVNNEEVYSARREADLVMAIIRSSGPSTHMNGMAARFDRVTSWRFGWN